APRAAIARWCRRSAFRGRTRPFLPGDAIGVGVVLERHHVAFADIALEHRLGELRLHQRADLAPQLARTVLGAIADVGQMVDYRLIELEGDALRVGQPPHTL